MKTKNISMAATIAVCVFAAPLAIPQTSQDLNDAKAEAFSDAFDAASDAAERAGDANLTCDQLGVELITIMGDAKLQNAAKQLGAPEEIIAPVAQYRAGFDKTVAAIRALRMLGFLMNFVQVAVPGLVTSGLAQLVGVAETTLWLSQQKQTDRMQSQLLARVSVLTPVLPLIARAGAVGELAEDRNCEFLKKLQEQEKK